MTTNREAPQSESLMGELREDGTGRMTFNHAGLTDPRRPFWTAFTAAETHYAVRMGSAGD